MEEKKAKIMINQSGGTAGGRAINYRLRLPTAWVEEMGINAENKEVKLTFIGGKIIIEKDTQT